MSDIERGWMQYIDGEVRAACDKKGLRSQLRSRDLARSRPVWDSPIDDYEWKPASQNSSPVAAAVPAKISRTASASPADVCRESSGMP